MPLRHARNLRIITRLGIGLDNIAVDEATRRGVWVTNVPTYCLEEVSDHAVAMILAWSRGLLHFDREVKAGRWEPASARLRRLSTLTCGIVGYGRIGQRTAHKLNAGFGARILAYDPFPRSGDPLVEFVPLDELLARSDVVIVHAPSTPETKHLINRHSLVVDARRCVSRECEPRCHRRHRRVDRGIAKRSSVRSGP